MKIVALLAGVAAVALTASAASAGNPIFQGSIQVPAGQAGPTVNTPTFGPVYANDQPPSEFTETSLGQIGLEYLKGVASQTNLKSDSTANVSLFLIQGGAADNNGTAENNDGATFTLKGAVSTDCAYYSGSSNAQTIDFGTIGIYASDNTGPAAAFDMTAPANVTIDSNLAGCNTSNTVTLSKSDIRGLVNNSSAGYDTNVFQANLPFSVTANYTAGAVGVAGAASPTSLVLDAASNSASAQHGAWKSAMALNVNIPVPSKSLLAGAYQGDLTVNIAAF